MTGGQRSNRNLIVFELSQRVERDEAVRKDYNTNPGSQRGNYRLNTDIDITKTTLVKVGVSGSLKKRNAPGQGGNVWAS